MWILLIEDDAAASRGIELMSRSEGHNCDIKRLGEDGLAAARLYDYGVILLDLMLPDMNGLEVLRALRSGGLATPVLILSGLGDAGIMSEALNAGADDDLVKPFENRELFARIQAVRRRCRGREQAIFRSGELTVDFDTQSVELGGKRIHLTPNEYGVLELLCQRQGVEVRKEAILNQLYAGRDEPDPKIVDVFVCKLRRKLAEASSGTTCIETVWGRGYMLREPISQTLGNQVARPAMPEHLAA
jgi:two-component system cell cycle response regulator CtrA